MIHGLCKSQNIKLLGPTCSEGDNFERVIACLGVQTNTRLQRRFWIGLWGCKTESQRFSAFSGGWKIKKTAGRDECSVSFFTIYICLINTSIITGIWEFIYSGYLLMSLCWWSDRVTKREGDDRVGNWMYSVIILQALQIINIRHRVWNWIFMIPVDSLWLAKFRRQGNSCLQRQILCNLETDCIPGYN